MPRSGYSNLLARYRRYAPDYDAQFAHYSEGTLAKALELIPAGAASLLDIACGTGIFQALLHDRFPDMRVLGIDISPEMLNNARQRFPADARIEFKTGTAEVLPVESGSFEVVTCNNAFHLVQDAQAALREIHRVLQPGGCAIIIDWCRDAPQMKAMAVALRLTDRQVRSIRGVRTMCALMEEHGFRIDYCERFRVKPMWGLMAIAATCVSP